CMCITNPYEMQDRRAGIDLNFTGYLSQEAALPELEADTKYVLSVMSRGETRPDIPGQARVLVSFWDQAEPRGAQTTRSNAQTSIKLSPEWSETTLELLAPRQTARLTVNIYLDNCGQACFDDVKLHRTTMDEGVTVRLVPGYFMDNVFCLSSGDPGIIAFGLRNEREAPVVEPRLMIELPESVEVLGTRDGMDIVARENVQRDGATFVRYAIDLKALASAMQKDVYSLHNGVSMVVRTAAGAGEQIPGGRYWFVAQGYETTPLEFGIRVLPPIAGERPAQFRTAAMFTAADCLFSDPAAVDALADFYVRAGFNSAHLRGTPLAQALLERGVERYSQHYWLCNGYRLGTGNKPPEVAFTLADGSALPEAICPTEVYRRGPYYHQAVVQDILRKSIVVDRSADQIMPNWEPHYNYKGCFCDRCRQEFIAHSELPREDVEKAWPANVIRDYRDQWVRFRSWQHGQMCRTLEEDISALGREVGIESHFIPEIVCHLLMEEHQQDEATAQYSSRDFLQYLPVLEPWGGYCSHNLYKPYVYDPGFHLKVQAVAGPVREFLDQNLPEGKRPRIIGLPHSFQGENMVTQPEAIGFDFLTYFANGWDGAFAYVFPHGYDARYWAALAGANSTIARLEQYLAGARQVNEHSLALQTPVPAPSPRWVEELGSDRMIYSFEWQKGDTRLFAVGNFWQRGECFFLLQPKGLAAGERYVLWEPTEDRCYANDAGGAGLTGADLAAGVLLHAGAMRYSFFVLEPWREGGKYGASIARPAQMRAAMQQRLPAIQQACARDQELAAAATGPAEDTGYANLTSVRKGELSCEPISFEATGK
ncbi:MAG TPA: hypothetical protein VM283_07075, partial [Armatimonadota bacterium]|nr:hypothetical protein [Armatimonadota bacterium]